MIAGKIESLRIRGFRSLADVDLCNLCDAKVLVGANGAGKSNFIRFFEMLSWMLRSRLGEFIATRGGADDQLYRGRSVTPGMDAQFALRTEAGRIDYRFALTHADPDRFVFSDEAFRCSADPAAHAPWQHAASAQPEAAAAHDGDDASDEGDRQHAASGQPEAAIVDVAQGSPSQGVNPTIAGVIVHFLGNCSVHQFHDTSATSDFRKPCDVADNNCLRTHGGNLAAVLRRLEQEDLERFELICRHVQRVLPMFDRFRIVESHGKVSLRWTAVGANKTVGAHLTSDASLRFFALVTLLNLPPEMLPSVLLLDGPDLGLHPAAVTLVGGMIKSLAADRQIIVATQSPLLVDAFDLEEIVVLDLADGRTTFTRPEAADFGRWLEDGYTTGEIWQKNLIGGLP